MKLDSTIIGALIIGASIMIGAFVYTYNSDYKMCVRETTERKVKRNKNIDLSKAVAIQQCRDIKR